MQFSRATETFLCGPRFSLCTSVVLLSKSLFLFCRSRLLICRSFQLRIVKHDIAERFHSNIQLKGGEASSRKDGSLSKKPREAKPLRGNTAACRKNLARRSLFAKRRQLAEKTSRGEASSRKKQTVVIKNSSQIVVSHIFAASTSSIFGYGCSKTNSRTIRTGKDLSHF
jgi:hypothetical protein